MRPGIRIGRVLGIDLRVDSSWLFIFVLITWSLTSLFGGWHPDWAPWTSFAVAVAAALLFFASLVFHEMAHSLVARAYGIPVRDITLHMFGGVSSIEREPESPGAELLIAIVGPISSVALGVVMLVATYLVTGGRGAADPAAFVQQMGPATTLFAWLGPVNVMVGLFNLIPGFPLDGGRILRALLWRLTNDLGRATRAATITGQLVGWTFIAMGIAMAFGLALPFFGRGLASGIWLALIGMFLRSAATQYYVSSAVKDALRGVPVSGLMRTRGPWVGADVTLHALVDHWFTRSDEDGFPVFDDGRFVGFVTVDDVRAARGEEWRTARDFMTPVERLPSASPDEPAYDALRRLAGTARKQIPVVSGGRLVGVLHEADAARWVDLTARPARRLRPQHA